MASTPQRQSSARAQITDSAASDLGACSDQRLHKPQEGPNPEDPRGQAETGESRAWPLQEFRHTTPRRAEPRSTIDPVGTARKVGRTQGIPRTTAVRTISSLFLAVGAHPELNMCLELRHQKCDASVPGHGPSTRERPRRGRTKVGAAPQKPTPLRYRH